MSYPRFLPFIGFRTLPIDNDGVPSEYENSRWKASCFMVEWFGQGIILFSTNIVENDGDIYRR